MDRATFTKYLARVHYIYILAESKGLNMSFDTRDAGTPKVWGVGYVWKEGTGLSREAEGKSFVNFHLYNWMDKEKWDAELASVEKWICEQK